MTIDPVQQLAALADEVLRRGSHAPRLIAIDGPSGSGKSTFATRLARAIGDAPIVAVDDFLAWDDLVRWWPRFEAEVLAPLLDGRTARYQVRDWLGDPFGYALKDWRETAPAEVVILEGNTSSRREIADRLALAVWVEAPRDLRMRRGLARDGEHLRGRWLDWMTMEDDFFLRDETKQRADLGVDGAPSLPHDPDSEFVLLTDW